MEASPRDAGSVSRVGLDRAQFYQYHRHLLKQPPYRWGIDNASIKASRLIHFQANKQLLPRDARQLFLYWLD
jgi:hypothetical protein